jgi:hypothetical protein
MVGITRNLPVAVKRHDADGDDVKVLSKKPFNEDKTLLTELAKLKPALASGNAVPLRAGIDTAVKEDGGKGFPTQAKYEMGDDGRLSLSIYTVKEGKDVLPEKSHTTERAGFPLTKSWDHGAEVFGAKGQDDEHVSRAAGFLTLMQETNVSIKEIANRASRYGMVYRVEPEVYKGKPAFNVLVLNSQGKAEQIKMSLPVHG